MRYTTFSKTPPIIVPLVAILFIGLVARAGFHCCQRCGCQERELICRLVCEEKKVNVTCWGCKDEDFCLPGPSERECKNCEMVCDDQGNPKGLSSCPKKFVWYSWTPNACGKIYTKQKLMKRTVTKTIPSYRWVVEDLCEQCQSNLPQVVVPPTVDIPPAPAVPNARIIEPLASNTDPSKAQ